MALMERLSVSELLDVSEEARLMWKQKRCPATIRRSNYQCRLPRHGAEKAHEDYESFTDGIITRKLVVNWRDIDMEPEFKAE